MQKLTLHLPKHRLVMQFKLAKKRKSSLDEPIIPTRKRLNIKYHVGGYFRKLTRHIFEHKAVKKLLGTNIALMLVATSFIPNSTLGSDSESDIATVVESSTPIHTNISIQSTVIELNISQGYKFFHPAIDIDGETGDPIKPIKAGVVDYVENSNVGYGKHVIVDHGNNLKTLYAHLSKINVKNGDNVTTSTVIGEMGSTGRSTGSHLHLEVRDHGVPVNPLSILPR